ncbi:AAA family ATPase [Epibacterium sp. DP7N7-1]|nr:AAA family ATPase [Epibacterium sp. DP7N7-1]
MSWLETIIADTASAETLTGDFPWAQAMIGCPHDPVYHAEGDPWVHTCMVSDQLRSGDGFDALTDDRREILRLSAWFHDIAKPMTTVIEWDEQQERDRVRQPGHAPLGAKIAWQALIDAGYDVIKARDVHAMVFWHQRPTHLMDQKNTLQRVIEFGHEAHYICWDDMLRLCKADQDGRICKLRDGADDNLELLRMFMEEQSSNAGVDLTTTPWPFPSDVARRKFLVGPSDTSPFFEPPTPSGSRMLLMSGLPGAGKDTAIAAHFPDLPVVALDDIRQALDVDSQSNQGRVIQAGFEAARVHLRAGRNFVWNTTGLTRQLRQKIIRLARDYDARVDAVSIDVPASLAIARNRGRPDPLPDAAITKLADKREPIVPSEVHGLWSVNASLELTQIFGGESAEPDVKPAWHG